MTAPVGYYDTSYPPSLWEPVQAVQQAGEPGEGDRLEATASTISRTLTVDAGAPGTYDPPVSAADRPRNVTELRDQARVTSPAPWAAGEFVQVGQNGKRAHWTGEDWKLGESPGYALPWEQPATGDQAAVVECAVEGCGVIETGTITEHPHDAAEDTPADV